MSSSDFQLRLATTPVLDDIVREGARVMLQQAVDDEVAQYIERHKDCRDGSGRRQVVRNGRKPEAHHPHFGRAAGGGSAARGRPPRR